MADGVQSLTKLGTQEYFWNYYELDNGYIDLNADYWDQSAIEALSIANHLYYITGEAIVSDNAATWAMYYNKDLLADNGLQNPVELVDAGTWTIDALYEMCKAVATKVSTGDTMSYDPADGDVWGMVTQAYDGLAFMWGAEQSMITKDEDDLPIMRIENERNVSAWQKISAMLYDKSCVGVADLFGPWSEMYAKESQIFTNGNAAFMPGRHHRFRRRYDGQCGHQLRYPADAEAGRGSGRVLDLLYRVLGDLLLDPDLQCRKAGRDLLSAGGDGLLRAGNVYLSVLRQDAEAQEDGRSRG